MIIVENLTGSEVFRIVVRAARFVLLQRRFDRFWEEESPAIAARDEIGKGGGSVG